MKKRDTEKNKRDIVNALAMVLQIGLALICCMCISLAIGIWLDRLFGTKFIVIIFMVIGFLASIRSMLVLTGRYKPGEMKKDINKDFDAEDQMGFSSDKDKKDDEG